MEETSILTLNVIQKLEMLGWQAVPPRLAEGRYLSFQKRTDDGFTHYLTINGEHGDTHKPRVIYRKLTYWDFDTLSGMNSWLAATEQVNGESEEDR